MSRWFRLYDDTLNDPKILKLSDKLHRLWIGVLCAASKNDGRIPQIDDLSLLVRMRVQKLRPLLESLIKSGLIDDDGAVLRPHNWDGRQYKSDVSTDRVKRFRERSKTVSVTPPDTDTDTERKTTRKSAREILWPSGFLEFYSAYPKKKSKKDAAKAYEAARREVPHDTIMAGLARIKPTWRDPKYIPYPASWLRDGGYDDDPNVVAFGKPASIPGIL